MSWQFATAGRILFGRGTIEEVGALAARLQVNRALVVTDTNLAAVGMVARVTALLEAAGMKVSIYDGCKPEPPLECAVEASQLAAKTGANGLIALGGGSNIDIAKMAAILLKYGGTPPDYFGFDRVPGPVAPLIACPTTAGTGSEVSNSSVLTDHAAATKVSSLSHYLRPAAAIVDPDLTDSCPAKVSAHSGIDALVHAIEAVTARSSLEIPGATQLERPYVGAYAFTELLGMEAIRLIGKSLVAAYQDGGNRAARDDMAMAALLAGMAFSNSGVALVHALEYPIGALTHCSHGEGNGLLLPHVMQYNLPTRITHFARIARALAGDRPELTQLSEAELAQESVEQVKRLQSALGIRSQLSQLGMDRSQLPSVATKAFSIKRLMATNPREPTEAELVELLERAF